MVKLAEVEKQVKEMPSKNMAPTPTKEVEESSEDSDDQGEAPPYKAIDEMNATPANTLKIAKQESDDEEEEAAQVPSTPGKRKAVAKKDNGTPPYKKTRSDGEAVYLSQRLTREERIEIVLMSGERSTRVISADFNARHPMRPPISHATVSKLLTKFRETGSVLDLPKCGRMKTVTNEETSVAVLSFFSKIPQLSTRRMSLASGISRTSLRRILATHKWNP